MNTTADHNTSPGSSLLRYRLMLLLLFPVLVLYSLWQGIRHRDLRYSAQRLGFAYGRCPQHPLWLHCASVGEVQASLPLIKAIKEKHPELAIVLSSTTPTGAQIAKKRLGQQAHCISLPIDWSYAVARVLRSVNPRCLLVMETELWPNLYSRCATNCPIVIINARLSARTTNTSSWVKQLYGHTLQQTSAILSRSAQDSELFLAMGADSNKINTLGNLKFAITPPGQSSPHPLDGKAYVLAASTHENEEQQIAAAWQQAKLQNLHLVIAPRHPIRRDSICKQLQSESVKFALRSKGQNAGDNDVVYIADTLGELMMFFEHATVVFMGGTLVPVGGHNILEPAVLGKAIVFGPHMHNFAFEAQQFLQQHGARQVNSAEELLAEIQKLQANPEQLNALGHQAKAIMDKHKDIIQRYLISLEPYIQTD